jgi:hypothetical protein
VDHPVRLRHLLDVGARRVREEEREHLVLVLLPLLVIDGRPLRLHNWRRDAVSFTGVVTLPVLVLHHTLTCRDDCETPRRTSSTCRA